MGWFILVTQDSVDNSYLINATITYLLDPKRFCCSPRVWINVNILNDKEKGTEGHEKPVSGGKLFAFMM